MRGQVQVEKLAANGWVSDGDFCDHSADFFGTTTRENEEAGRMFGEGFCCGSTYAAVADASDEDHFVFDEGGE